MTDTNSEIAHVESKAPWTARRSRPRNSAVQLGEQLAAEDKERFDYDVTWGAEPTVSMRRLAARGEAEAHWSVERWVRADAKLTSRFADRLHRYERLSEQLGRAERAEEQQSRRYESLVKRDARSFDPHRRFERRSGISNVLHVAVLAIFAVGEFPLNWKSLDQLGASATSVPLVKQGLAFALGVAVLAAAHFAGVVVKRIVTDEVELGRAREETGAPGLTGPATKTIRFVRLGMAISMLVFGILVVGALGFMRNAELEGEQKAAALAASRELIKVQADGSQDLSPLALVQLERKSAALALAQSKLCDFTAKNAAANAGNVRFCKIDKSSQGKLRGHPFLWTASALALVQMLMFVIAFAIAFKSHDETLHQVKAQYAHYTWAKRKATYYRRRHRRAGSLLSHAQAARMSRVDALRAVVESTKAAYTEAQLAYLRQLQGDKAVVESSETPTVEVEVPNISEFISSMGKWSETVGIGIRDYVLSPLNLADNATPLRGGRGHVPWDELDWLWDGGDVPTGPVRRKHTVSDDEQFQEDDEHNQEKGPKT